MTARMSAILLAVAIAASVSGCGSGVAPGALPSNEQNLTELKMLLEEHQKAYKKPPAKQADAARLEPSYPGAVRLLGRGEIVYAWGIPLAAGGSGVVAYHMDAPEKGGTVLLEDGTVKELTAAEFATAPKAGKK